MFFLFITGGNEILVLEYIKKDTINRLSDLRRSMKNIQDKIFRLLFESMSEGCALHQIIFDENYQPIDYLIVDVNQAYEKILGLKRESVVGRQASVVYGSHAPPYLDIYAEVASSGEPRNFETFFAPMQKHFLISVFSPEAGFFATVFSDITERKNAEKILRDSEEQFRIMFQSHQAVMLLIDPDDGKIIDANSAALTFYGYSHDVLCNMKITEINQLNPELTEIEWKRALNKQRNYFVFNHRISNGEIRKVEVYSSPIIIKSKSFLFSVIHDVTERTITEEKLQKSEELYRSLFNHMLNGFAYCRIINEPGQPLDFVYLAINAAFEKSTGLKGVEGKRVSEVIPGIQQTDYELLDTYNRVSLSGIPEQFEIHLKSLDMWFAVAVYSPQKGYFVAVFDVITERKQQEIALKEELNVRANFMNILAHEIRTPLSPILSSSQILYELLEATNDERVKRLALNVYSGAQTLSIRVGELLDLARFAKGTFIPNRKVTNIPEYIDGVVMRYKPSIDQSDHTLNVTIAKDLPGISLDQSRIEQVLINLLSNAAKYSPKNSQIDLAVKTENGFLVMEVQDRGKGISNSDQKLLFKPYRRLEGDRKNSAGLGLGLSICKQIIEAHNGSIEVISKLGDGSLFRVSLPLIQETLETK